MDLNTNLDTSWTLYLHLPRDNDWTTSSYKIVKTTYTLNDLFTIFNNIPDSFSLNAMLFFMRETIKPIWEDENNRNGGCISFKLSHDNIQEVYKKICYSIATNTLCEDKEFIKNINGVTISPKKNFYIIKLWLKNKDNKYISNLESFKTNIDELNFIECIFKEHSPEF